MKSRKTAALLALFLGSFGIHQFYLRRPGMGLLFILVNIFGLRMMGLPVALVMGIFNAIMLFLMSDETFNKRYNRDATQQLQSRREQMNTRTSPRSVTNQRRRKSQINKNNPFKLSGIKKMDEYDIRGAIDDFEKSLDIYPEDPEVHYQLARAYSLSEKADQAYQQLSLAVRYGFKDYEKIRKDEALAYLRIHKDFESFERAGYRVHAPLSSDVPANDETILVQLQRLAEMRKQGLITDQDFEVEKRRLMS